MKKYFHKLNFSVILNLFVEFLSCIFHSEFSFLGRNVHDFLDLKFVFKNDSINIHLSTFRFHLPIWNLILLNNDHTSTLRFIIPDF